MTAPLIGIMGRKRAGKDTVAARLVQHHGYTRFAFADPMREALLALDPRIDVDNSDAEPFPVLLSAVVHSVGWERAKELPEIRRLLQRFGTEMGRAHFGEDFWVDLLWRQIDAHNTREVAGLRVRTPYPRPVVITDVRFPNEAARIKREGGTLVRIVRTSDILHDDPHASESALDGWSADAVIHNDSTIDRLNDRADWLANLIGS